MKSFITLFMCFLSNIIFNTEIMADQPDKHNFYTENNKIIILINKYYIDRDVSKNIITLLGKKNCQSSKNSQTYAQCVNRAFQEAAHDPHLNLIFYKNKNAPTHHLSIHEFLSSLDYAKPNKNFGFHRAQFFKHNIGLISMDFFPPRDIGEETLDAAMFFLKNTNALIIDLRNNIGGDPDMVRYFASYFLAKRPILLNTIQWSTNKNLEKIFSTSTKPSWRYLDKPVFILVSHKTFSAAEEFTYDLQQLHRVTVVGEVTAGGANPGELFPISRELALYLPIGKSINPYTKTNWEKTGVQPDVVINSSSAFKNAYEMALHF